LTQLGGEEKECSCFDVVLLLQNLALDSQSLSPAIFDVDLIVPQVVQNESPVVAIVIESKSNAQYDVLLGLLTVSRAIQRFVITMAK
jgi:hypothetical protein